MRVKLLFEMVWSKHAFFCTFFPFERDLSRFREYKEAARREIGWGEIRDIG